MTPAVDGRPAAGVPRMRDGAGLLTVEDLQAGYGAIPALWDISLRVGRSEIVAIIGANGAGKTTLLRTISGLIRPMSGAITFKERPIHGRPAETVVRLGIAHVPEGRRLFGGLSVMDNLLLGAYGQMDRAAIRRRLDFVFGVFPILYDRRRQQAGTLSGGEQQMCAISRALMANPELLLIDELSLGLAPIVVERLMGVVKALNREAITVLLVEQDVRTALEIAERGYVIEAGRIRLEGSAEALLSSDLVKKAFLGA